METITSNPSTQFPIRGKFGRLISVQRVELSDSGTFSEGENLYCPGKVVYIEAISTYIITHGGNIYTENQNPGNCYVNIKVTATRGDPGIVVIE